MEYKEASYNRYVGIDCQINHPTLGWIPTTLTADDSETAGLFATVSQGAVAAYVEPVLTNEEIKTKFEAAVKVRLNEVAKAKGYDDIVSACSYAGTLNDYQAESVALLQWRASVWTYCYAELVKLVAGTRAAPTVEDFILELPAAPV